MARDFLKGLLSESRHVRLEDSALLCVTELVANVARHTASSACLVRVVDEPEDLLIEVIDESPELPVMNPTPADSEGGRGLRIIDALAGQWGVRSNPGDGKAVWIRLCDD